MNLLSTFFAALIKDLKLVAKHRSSLLLVLATPLIIVLLIGGLYSEPVDEAEGKIPLFVCDLDTSSLSMNFTNELGRVFVLGVVHDNCADMAQDYVETGFFKSAVILPPGFEDNILEGRSSELAYFYDNTDITLRLIARAMLIASVQRLSNTIGNQFISGVWGELKQISDGLDQAQYEINASESDLIKLRATILNLRESLQRLTGTFTSL